MNKTGQDNYGLQAAYVFVFFLVVRHNYKRLVATRMDTLKSGWTRYVYK